jgi:alpha-tubulin suppressor-like RCC1 family protein
MATLPTMEAIGAGSYSSYAITTTGALYAWGDNGFGELGTGDNNPVPVPVLVGPAAGQSSLPPVSSVTGGDFYTLLDTTAGALYGIGYGGDGQLGTGDGDATTYVTTPSLLPAQTSLAGLGANSNFALAVVGPPPTGGGPVTPGGRRAPAKAPARRR